MSLTDIELTMSSKTNLINFELIISLINFELNNEFKQQTLITLDQKRNS